MSTGLVLLAVVVAVGAIGLTREAQAARAESEGRLAIYHASLPELVLLEPEVWTHDLERVYRLGIKNVGAGATVWANLRRIQPAAQDTWTADWGRGDNRLGSPRVQIAKGETLRIALARVQPVHVEGTRVVVLALDGGQRVYAWDSPAGVEPPPQCVIEIEIFSDPGTGEPLRARYMIDRYNFRRVDL